MSEEERYYSINEIAAKFKVTRTAVYDWMNSGRLDFVVVGARRRVTQAQLDKFLEAGTRAVKQEGGEKNATPGELTAMAA